MEERDRVAAMTFALTSVLFFLAACVANVN